MAIQNGPVVTAQEISDMRKQLGIPEPESDDPNIIAKAMDAAMEAAKDVVEPVEEFFTDHEQLLPLFLAYCLGAGTVLLTLLATRL